MSAPACGPIPSGTIGRLFVLGNHAWSGLDGPCAGPWLGSKIPSTSWVRPTSSTKPHGAECSSACVYANRRAAAFFLMTGLSPSVGHAVSTNPLRSIASRHLISPSFSQIALEGISASW